VTSRERRVPSEGEMQKEADSITAGPGVLATKSQARGGLIGVLAGAFVGAIVGVVIGLLAFEGAVGVVVATIAFAAAGATAGGVAGGFVGPRRRLGSTEADK
jgi:hypothetical protein